LPKMIKSKEYLFQKIRYIHANPIRNQYVRSPEAWLWSFANPENKIRVELVLSMVASSYNLDCIGIIIIFMRVCGRVG